MVRITKSSGGLFCLWIQSGLNHKLLLNPHLSLILFLSCISRMPLDNSSAFVI